MAQERDRDDLERDEPLSDDVQGMADEDADEGDEGDEVEDEDEFSDDEQITGEVGSEGGSPGENVRTREPRTPRGGSEDTETMKKDR